MKAAWLVAPVAGLTGCNVIIGFEDPSLVDGGVGGVWGQAVHLDPDGENPRSPEAAVDSSGGVRVVWEQDNAASQAELWSSRYTREDGWAVATRIVPASGSAIYNRAIAVDVEGNAFVLWWGQLSTTPRLQAIRYGAAADTWAAPVAIDAPSGGYVNSARVAFDPSGNAIAIWDQYDGAIDNVWTNRYIVGAGWGAATLLENDDGSAGLANVGIDADGNALAVWTQSVDLVASRNADGNWSTATPIDGGVAPDGSVTFAVGSQGHAFALWEHFDGELTRVWQNRFDGAAWGTAALLESSDAGGSRRPVVAAGPNDEAVAAWLESSAGGGGGRVGASRYEPTGGWTDPERLESLEAESVGVAAGPSGDALCIWTRSDAALRDVHARAYRPGAGWQAATRIEDELGLAAEVELRAGSAGDAVAIWLHNTGTDLDLWANVYQPAP